MTSLQDERTLCQRLDSNDDKLDRLLLREPRQLLCSPSFEAFLEALKKNSTVKNVVVGELVVQVTEESKLCRLLEGLGNLKNLEQVEFTLPHLNVRKRLSAASLGSFLNNAKKLRTLVLWPFIFLETRSDVDIISNALRSHPSLRDLSFLNVLLGPIANEVHLDPMLESLSTAPNLLNLQISAGFRVQENFHPVQKASSLQKLLESSRSLNSFALRNIALTDDDCHAMAQTLAEHKHTTHLKYLDLRHNKIGPAGYVALWNCLKDNYRLEYVEIDSDDKELLTKINFFLRINRAGRYAFLKDAMASRSQRVEILIEARRDIDVTFYLLRQNPLVCQTPNLLYTN